MDKDHEEKLDTKSCLLDHRDLLWYAPARKRKPALTIHHALVSDLISLVHTMHSHPGVASTLVLLRKRFHWLTRTRDVREYVFSCGCRRRKRSTSQRIVMLPGHITHPCAMLEIDLIRVGVASLT